MEEAVVRFLDKFHIHVKLNWLKAVIEFAKLHGVGNEEATLCQAVLEQLLHSDLSDSYEPLAKVPVIAVRAVIVKQMIFQSYQFCLSLLYVVSIIDTARSCYDQYCERINNEDDLSWFHGDNEDENEVEQQSPDAQQVKSSGRRRMLKIKLFDGQNTVHAIEYGGKVQLELDENTLPGTKVLNGDVDGKPMDLKSLFAERLGIKQDVKGQQRSSTISPFLVRIPRIPNQAADKCEMKNEDTKAVVKREVYDNERTAVVPPLQSNLVSAAIVPPFSNNFMPKTNLAPSKIQKQLLQPPDESSHSSKSTSSVVEVSAFVLAVTVKFRLVFFGNSQIIPHVLSKNEPKICRSLRTNVNSLGNKSITEYFPVSRIKREVEEITKNEPPFPHPIRPLPIVPLSEQRLTIAVDKNDEVVRPELRENHEGNEEDNPLLNDMVTPPSTRKEVISALNRSRNNSNTVVKTDHPVDNEIPIGLEETVMMTTQELINSSAAELVPSQNDSDLLSFIAHSVSKEVNVQEFRTPPRTHSTKDPPSTAVVPYKRGRLDDRVQQIQRPMMLPAPRLRPSHASVVDKFNDLNVIHLNDAFSQRKFWMLPKVVRVMGICHIKGELVAKHGLWLLDVYITDESMTSQRCTVDGQLLERLLGFTVRHCERLNMEKNMHELSRCKRRALEVMKSFERLDLVFSLEIHPEKFRLPLVVNVCCLAEALSLL
ncbi:hypothetical protein KIN20_018565 [Parelaphostrongylus tenuis]|uniref:RecQ-mediated genome instability protein 1 n=1 Tax=Parelaphostrongylus tenuis TaxID=148309 RepID=A0AAD5N262_PARTN|nr:hypothetical protein KIN20_018565 [Parelaphostrongylus tenuis]